MYIIFTGRVAHSDAHWDGRRGGGSVIVDVLIIASVENSLYITPRPRSTAERKSPLPIRQFSTYAIITTSPKKISTKAESGDLFLKKFRTHLIAGKLKFYTQFLACREGRGARGEGEEEVNLTRELYFRL